MEGDPDVDGKEVSWRTDMKLARRVYEAFKSHRERTNPMSNETDHPINAGLAPVVAARPVAPAVVADKPKPSSAAAGAQQPAAKKVEERKPRSDPGRPKRKA